MSEQKKNFMKELDLWSEANVIGPLFHTDPNQEDWNGVVEQVKKAIRTKVLESYRNGQNAPARVAKEVAMGADLYIETLYTPTYNRWSAEFERAVAARDEAPDETSRLAAQARVEDAYDQMHSCGYFRDPYNDRDLLWKFGLSWWEDVIPMLDENSQLSPSQAQRLLHLLKERETRFETALAEVRESDQRSFRKRYAELQSFLNDAVALNEPIVCSL